MFGMGPLELMIVGIIVVLLFGNRLPRVGQSLQQGIEDFELGRRNPMLWDRIQMERQIERERRNARADAALDRMTVAVVLVIVGLGLLLFAYSQFR